MGGSIFTNIYILYFHELLFEILIYAFFYAISHKNLGLKRTEQILVVEEDRIIHILYIYTRKINVSNSFKLNINRKSFKFHIPRLLYQLQLLLCHILKQILFLLFQSFQIVGEDILIVLEQMESLNNIEVVRKIILFILDFQLGKLLEFVLHLYKRLLEVELSNKLLVNDISQQFRLINVQVESLNVFDKISVRLYELISILEDCLLMFFRLKAGSQDTSNRLFQALMMNVVGQLGIKKGKRGKDIYKKYLYGPIYSIF